MVLIFLTCMTKYWYGCTSCSSIEMGILSSEITTGISKDVLGQV